MCVCVCELLYQANITWIYYILDMYNIKYIYIYVCVCVFDIDVVQKASKNCLVCKKLPFPNTLFVYSSFFWHVHGVHGPCITTTAVLPWFVAAKLKGWNQQLQRTFWSFNAQFHNCQLGSVLSKSTSFQLQSKFQIKTMGGRKSKSSFSVDCFSKKNDVPLEHSKPHFASFSLMELRISSLKRLYLATAPNIPWCQRRLPILHFLFLLHPLAFP